MWRACGELGAGQVAALRVLPGRRNDQLYSFFLGGGGGGGVKILFIYKKIGGGGGGGAGGVFVFYLFVVAFTTRLHVRYMQFK